MTDPTPLAEELAEVHLAALPSTCAPWPAAMQAALDRLVEMGGELPVDVAEVEARLAWEAMDIGGTWRPSGWPPHARLVAHFRDRRLTPESEAG